MNIHFIFLIKEDDIDARSEEFKYVKKMGSFFGHWIQHTFGVMYKVQCDIMVTARRGLLQRPDTHTLLRDHMQRGQDTYHFYLAYFRPLWTDCTCEGYHAENFGMVWWQRKNPADVLFMAERNCTAVSHELAHELLRQRGYKKFIPDVHDIWTRHLFSNLPFCGYDASYAPTEKSPVYLTIDTTDLDL